MSTRESSAPQTSHASVIDRRTYVRLASNLEATCRPAGRDVGWPGTVRDISQGGIGLLLTHRFQPGTQLTVELRDGSGAVRRILRVRVVHATAANIGGNSGWRLGCAFDTPLTEEEFEALR